MNISNMKVSDIRPYEKNPRLNEGAVDAVAASGAVLPRLQHCCRDRQNIFRDMRSLRIKAHQTSSRFGNFFQKCGFTNLSCSS